MGVQLYSSCCASVPFKSKTRTVLVRSGVHRFTDTVMVYCKKQLQPQWPKVMQIY